MGEDAEREVPTVGPVVRVHFAMSLTSQILLREIIRRREGFLDENQTIGLVFISSYVMFSCESDVSNAQKVFLELGS